MDRRIDKKDSRAKPSRPQRCFPNETLECRQFSAAHLRACASSREPSGLKTKDCRLSTEDCHESAERMLPAEQVVAYLGGFDPRVPLPGASPLNPCIVSPQRELP